VIKSRCVLWRRFSVQTKENNASGKRTHEIAFRDEGPSEPTVDSKVEPRSKRSKNSKSFGPDFIAYAIESESQTFKEVISTLEAQMWKKL